MKKDLSKIPYEMISVAGEIIYSDIEVTEYISGQRDILQENPNSAPKQFAFPLGHSELLNDNIALFSGDVDKLVKHGVIFSDQHVCVFTNIRKPLMIHGKITGIINTYDLGYQQLITNPCFQNLEPITYQYENFTKNDIKLLVLLSQYKKLKNNDIKNVFDIKISTTYIYKHELSNKLKYIMESQEISQVGLLNDMFKISAPKCDSKEIKDSQFIVLPEKEFLIHCKNLSQQKAKILKFENNFDDQLIENWKKLLEYVKK
ncbi:hypothetical protein L3V83_02330 [Thiotrichales bacterium 19X7-9]|nr:hypothetical protein [Thiotrichales bacterium 19X7-9]